VKEYEPILGLVELLSGLLAFSVSLISIAGAVGEVIKPSTNAWYCVGLISLAGAVGGVINALLSGHSRVILPSYHEGVWCPGIITNVLIGAVAALTSWALYGSGAGVELAQTNLSEEISLKLPALAGALLVGIAGAKWLTSESDKGLYKESVKEAGKKPLTDEQRERVVQGSALEVLQKVKAT
jgi:hypothetical protein